MNLSPKKVKRVRQRKYGIFFPFHGQIQVRNQLNVAVNEAGT